MTAKERIEGWAFPGTSRKAHYMRATMSLCRKWGFWRGAFTGTQTMSLDKPHPDDCVACWKVRRRELDAEVTA